MKVAAAVARRLEPHTLELGGDVFGGKLASPGAGPATLQGIVGQELEMGTQDVGVDRSGNLGARDGCGLLRQ
jgi:hypothetical protein